MSLIKSGAIVALLTFLSRIFGLIRELFIAYSFGTGKIADAVNIAFKIPNLFRRIFGEGALSLVFIPIFNQKLNKSTESAKEFASKTFSMLIFTLIILTLVMEIFMPQIMLIIAPGFLEDQLKFDLTVMLCRITAPYVILISLVALYGGVLNSINRFAPFAATPVIMNIIIIKLTLILSYFLKKEIAISFAILLSGIVQLFFIIKAVQKYNMNFPLSLTFINQDTKFLIKQFIPALLNAGVIQINLFISQSIASFIPGAVSILSYAERIYQFPLSVIGIAISTVLLPKLSKLTDQKDKDEASSHLKQAIEFSLILSIPCVFGIISLAKPIIYIIYQRGAFNYQDTLMTANAMIAFCLGLPAFILIKVITPIFYSKNDTKTPLRITIYSLLLNTILNIVFMYFFGYIGIAIGSSIAAWFNLYIIIYYAKGKNILNSLFYLKYFVFKISLVSIIMSALIILMRHYLDEYIFSVNLLIKIIIILSIILCAMLSYFLGAIICQILPPLNSIKNLIKK